jgi:hypothetical protein
VSAQNEYSLYNRAAEEEQVRANARAGLWQPSGEDLVALAAVNAGRGSGMTHRSSTRSGPSTGLDRWPGRKLK